MEEREQKGQPRDEPSPSTPDEAVPSEEDVKEAVPGVPDDERPAEDD
jgi:hypothetical protein